MSATSSSDDPKRTMRRNEETTKFWAKIKRCHGEQDLNKVQQVLDFLGKKFNDEPRLTTKVRLDLLIELEPLVEEGLNILDEAEANHRSARGQGVTGYLDRVQTVLESRYH
ncbi:hypothetical protein BGZ96_010055 [Linnemannia gamsii]|uniref:Uncharacterized protein n=1 Tax=Linnemannia gamsii TaxID=64522 RepID=A0ABQ7JVG5_9FUNG|nr:hypothetical protein BGZ96_010055 [Linnemannia gamsii]